MFHCAICFRVPEKLINRFSAFLFRMAEGGNERYLTSDSDSDFSILDSENSEDDDGEELCKKT